MPECTNRLLKLSHRNNPSWFVNEDNSDSASRYIQFRDFSFFSRLALFSIAFVFLRKNHSLPHCRRSVYNCASVYLSFISLRFVFLVQFTERDRITNFKWLIEVNGFMAVAEISKRWAFRRFFKCVSLVILSLACFSGFLVDSRDLPAHSDSQAVGGTNRYVFIYSSSRQYYD